MSDKKQLGQKTTKSAELKLIKFLHEHNLPFLLMDHLSHLIKSICPDSQIGNNIKCSRTSRTKSVAITKDCLAEAAMEEIRDKLAGSFYSIIVDETTDIRTQKSLAVVVRFYDHEIGVQDKFLGLIRVHSTTAENLFGAITKHLENNKIPLENMIGLAAVIMGKMNSVQSRFKQIVPNLFVMGCVCHSFHLYSSAAANRVTEGNRFIQNNFKKLSSIRV